MAKVTLMPEAAAEFENFAAIRSKPESFISSIACGIGQTLAGPNLFADHWRVGIRIRTGDYRMQFRVEGEEVRIEKIGHRDRILRGLNHDYPNHYILTEKLTWF